MVIRYFECEIEYVHKLRDGHPPDRLDGQHSAQCAGHKQTNLIDYLKPPELRFVIHKRIANINHFQLRVSKEKSRISSLKVSIFGNDLLTNPEMMIYSQMNTTISGIMNFTTDGSSRNFRFNPFMNSFLLLSFISILDPVPYCVTDGDGFSFKFKSNSIVATDTFCICIGNGRITQNVAASRTGITRKSSSVYCGGMPTAISEAYDSEPNMPAPPVPDDHALITRLQINKNITSIILEYWLLPSGEL